ncbi:MAG: phosphate acyltransferase PlsX, partial [Planctomycetota bacterium]|nr:phosphate acyltransferase PlsX [Planctomycetota bacterium]
MRIALDAMGGDHAPAPIVAGAIEAARTHEHLHVVLVGDR